MLACHLCASPHACHSRSIGTLCVFCFVCSAVLARRYTSIDGANEAVPRRPVLLRIAGLAASGLLLALSTELLGKAPVAVFVVLAVPLACAFCYCVFTLSRFPQLTQPKKFAVPWLPYVPAAGMYACLQLIASLGPIAWLRFVVYYTFCTLGYCYYRGGTDPHLADAAAAQVADGPAAAGHEDGERLPDHEAGADGIELAALPGDGNPVARRQGGSVAGSDDEQGITLSAGERRAAEKRQAKQGLLAAPGEEHYSSS